MSTVALLTEELPWLRKTAARMADNAHDADDVAQDALIKAWLRFESYDPSKGALRPWLYRIVQNTWRDEQRRRQKSNLVLIGERDTDT